MLPRVILHTAITADGRTDSPAMDVELYYELAGRWPVDGILIGSETMIAATPDAPPEDESIFYPRPVDPADERPWIAVVDSRGRFRNWHVLVAWPYMRGVVALVAHGTPQEYRDYLAARHIDALVAGDEQVNLRAALEQLNARYGVTTVRVDSGGGLNGALLAAGLVDEVSLLVHPVLLGPGPTAFYRLPTGATSVPAVMMRLQESQTMRSGIVWLRYEVVK